MLKHRWLVPASILYYVACILLLHITASELNPIEREISYYLDSDWRVLATTTFFALSLSLASSAVCLRTSLRPGPLSYIGFALLLIAAVGVIAAGLFPSELSAASRRIHQLASDVAIPSMLVGTISFKVAMYRDPRWRGMRLVVLGLGLAPVVVLVGALQFGRELNIGGLLQRVFFAFLLIWMFVTTRYAAGGKQGSDAA